jgi:2-polyprenyl-3-methyl-5-hydroxy-6-metoxy-1,4-benzoquinol methylase
MKMKRLENAMDDLIGLNKNVYCDLGPGRGYISMKLKEKNKEVVAVEAPWVKPEYKSWAQKHDIKMYDLEFFSGDFSQIQENVDCFILIHSIAHFKHSPYLLFEKIYNKLPKGGLFYLSTVNGTDINRVMDFMKGKPVVQKVSKDLAPGFNDVTQDFNSTGMRQIWDDWMHVKEYTKPEIDELFINSGFQLEKSFYRNNFKHWKKDIFIKLFPHLSEEIVVIGRKP